MDSNIEYDPFNYAVMPSDETNIIDETNRIIKKTHLASSQGKRVVKEEVEISDISIVLKPKK